jgi:hypothetical protein
MINAEQFFVLFAHISQRVDLAPRVHGKKPLWLVSDIGDRDATLRSTLSGAYQAADFLFRGDLSLMQNMVNQMSRQDDSFHGLTITGFACHLYPVLDSP